MIRHIENLSETQTANILEFCKDSCIGLKAAGPLLSYGTTYSFAEFWTQLKDEALTAFICRFYGVVTVYVSQDADTEELEYFLGAIGCTQLESNVPLKVSSSVETVPAGFIMRLEAGQPCTAVPASCETELVLNGSLKDFYNLLNLNYPDNVFACFDDWLVDLSHRVRHGTTETALLKAEGEYIATAAALVKSDVGVLIGAISTNENCRGKHYAHTLVKFFADKYKDRIRYIMCKPDKKGLYEKAGFICSGEFYRV